MPTSYTGAITSFTDTDAQVRCIEELINNVSPTAVPLTKLLGGLSTLNNPPVTSTKYEWLEDTNAPTSAVMDSTGLAATDSVSLGLSTTLDSKFFRLGHILQIDSELVRVTASDYAGTLTITRSFGGTTAAAHTTASTTIHIVGVAMLEGADASTGFKMDVSTGYNYVCPKGDWTRQPAMAA